MIAGLVVIRTATKPLTPEVLHQGITPGAAKNLPLVIPNAKRRNPYSLQEPRTYRLWKPKGIPRRVAPRNDNGPMFVAHFLSHDQAQP